MRDSSLLDCPRRDLAFSVQYTKFAPTTRLLPVVFVRQYRISTRFHLSILWMFLYILARTIAIIPSITFVLQLNLHYKILLLFAT